MALQKLTHIEPQVIEKMAGLLDHYSPEAIQACLGIGVNTWIKLRRGEAIRQSVAARLMDRFQQRMTS